VVLHLLTWLNLPSYQVFILAGAPWIISWNSNQNKTHSLHLFSFHLLSSTSGNSLTKSSAHP